MKIKLNVNFNQLVKFDIKITIQPPLDSVLKTGPATLLPKIEYLRIISFGSGVITQNTPVMEK